MRVGGLGWLIFVCIPLYDLTESDEKSTRQSEEYMVCRRFGDFAAFFYIRIERRHAHNFIYIYTL